MHGHIISKQIKIKLVDANHVYYLSFFLALSQKGKIQTNYHDLEIYVLKKLF